MLNLITRSRYFVFVGVFLAFSVSYCVGSHAYETRKRANSIVAVVNDDVVTSHEVNVMLAPVYFQMRSEISSETELNRKLEEAKREILDQVIEEKILVKEAKKLQINVSEEEVEARVKNVRSDFKTDADFNDALEAQGITMEDLKERFRNQFLVNRLIDREIKQDVYIGPSEIYSYYDVHKDEFAKKESVNLHNILIRLSDYKDVEEARDKAKEILAMIRGGKSFEECAKQYSKGPYSDKGGDMGLVERGSLVDELDKVVFDLEEGQVCGPIRSELGYHIVKVEKKNSAQVAAFGEVKDKIYAQIFQTKAENKYNKWIKKLKDDAYISVR